MSELVTRPAVELLALVADGRLSVAELAEAQIARIAEVDPSLNSFVDFDPEQVRAEARRLDMWTGKRGPLHGLPVTVKSTISVAGLRCETGSLLYEGVRATEDAVVVKRLRAAGALLLGTTNCPEFLMAYDTDNRLHGRTSNPWDLERTPGGSSGGESAAIAAGMSAGGIGSDAGGSVRVPAHFTGICALKPTPGRIPSKGHVPTNVGPFASLSALGPMARTMADVELLFRVLQGAEETDPAGAPVPLRTWKAEALRASPIGYFEDDGLVPVTAETRAAVRAAAEALRESGFRVEPFRPAALERARLVWWKLFVRGGAMLLEPGALANEALLTETFLDFRRTAGREAALSGEELLAAWMEADEVRRELLEEMRAYPVLLLPACAIPAFRHGERSWVVEGRRLDYLDAMRFTQWFNLLAGPAAVVPVGRCAEGLPIAVQVAGRPWEDERVIAVAQVVDEASGYRPPKVYT